MVAAWIGNGVGDAVAGEPLDERSGTPRAAKPLSSVTSLASPLCEE